MTDEFKKDLKEITQAVISKYGAEVQIDIAIEEMSELTKALLKYRRYQKTRNTNGTFKANVALNYLIDIYDDLDKIEIILFQLREIFDGSDLYIGNAEEIQKRKIAGIKEKVLKK